MAALFPGATVTDTNSPYYGSVLPQTGGGGGGGGGGAGQRQSQNFQQSSGGSFFSNPQLVQQLSGALGRNIEASGNDYLNFIRNPGAHPAYLGALQGVLGALEPSEAAGRRGLMDMFRGAGNTSSSTFGNEAAALESGFMRERGNIASQLMASLFPQIAQAYYAPMSQTSQLVDALKLNQQQMTGGGYDVSKQVSGGGGGGGGGTTFSSGTPLPKQFGGGGFGNFPSMPPMGGFTGNIMQALNPGGAAASFRA